jgi:hypothetical protein
MTNTVTSKAIWRALTTVNAPLPRHISAHQLLACLQLSSKDMTWRPHVRAFFNEVGIGVIMDMVVEGSVSFEGLSKAIAFWNVDEESDNARWIREMAAVPVATADV